ncbi:MAG: peptidylprolyl isomerase [Acidimicrobiales bacterium]
MPSDKRARQRAAREARLAAQAKSQKRRKQIRNAVIVVVIAAVVLGIVVLVSGNNKKAPPTAQEKANQVAVAAGCPSSPSTRVNTQSYASPPPMTLDTAKTYTATVVTTLGTFTIDLDAQAAPVTVNNFVFLADKGFYHCNTFLRVIPGFVDQTGDPTGTGTGGPGYKFADENVPKAYATGDVAMANSGGTDTNGSQFFLVAPGGATQLDNDLSSGGYSLFGTVSSGQSVVNAINAQGSSSGTPPKVTQRMLSVTIHES